MLVLTRKIGEEIVIGGDIRIKVLEVRGAKVRIGVVAPDDVIEHQMAQQRHQLGIHVLARHPTLEIGNMLQYRLMLGSMNGGIRIREQMHQGFFDGKVKLHELDAAQNL